MLDLGFKRKELSCCVPEKPAKNWEDEVVYPEIHADGKLADVMGAEDLKEGDVVEVPVKMRVKRHTKIEEDGKTTYSMTLCVEQMGEDMKVSEGESEESEDEDSDDDDYDAPMMAVLGVDK